MGKGFGNLGLYVRNIITYSVSPHEQRAFAGFLTHSPGNLLRRFFDQVFYVAPGFVIVGFVWHYGKKDFERRLRKNPADYVNEE